MVQLLLALFLLFQSPLSLAQSTCGKPATPIASVQGPGEQSPMAGNQVTVEGILTRDARQGTGLKGFYLQQADTETDDNPATSEALFVYTRKNGGREGDRLRVKGYVKEYHGLTELVRISELLTCGRGEQPAPVEVSLPWHDKQPPEALENMRITVTGPLTVIDQYLLYRYGQVTLATSDQWIPTQRQRPGHKIQQVIAKQHKTRLILDDGRSHTNPDQITWLGNNRPPRTGDQTGTMTGILDYRFNAWRFHPDSPVTLHRHNPRPEVPARPAEANLRVMTINLHNYFNGNGQGGGFEGSRGARSQAALNRQTDKLVAALTAPDPDVIAVMELEADDYGELSSLAQLTDALGEPWRYIRTDHSQSHRAIRNGLLYRPDRAEPRGGPRLLELGEHQGRPVLAQSFQPVGAEQQVRIAVTHLKSKSCRNATGNNRDQDDGQGCWAPARTRAAERIADWLNNLPGPDNSRGNLLIGDLNSYAKEDPLTALARAGFRNLAAENAYSFRYKGRRGTLDYALADPTLIPAVLGSIYWPINSDEAPALAYDGPKQARQKGVWRASDHDPVITDLRL
jgi:predicted extracellular nuclease